MQLTDSRSSPTLRRIRCMRGRQRPTTRCVPSPLPHPAFSNDILSMMHSPPVVITAVVHLRLYSPCTCLSSTLLNTHPTGRQRRSPPRRVHAPPLLPPRLRRPRHYRRHGHVFWQHLRAYGREDEGAWGQVRTTKLPWTSTCFVLTVKPQSQDPGPHHASGRLDSDCWVSDLVLCE